jgi:cellulose synthase/poly-beta-1,6-N-acetylglucosamine synthase-like glycosyltransferase
MKLFVSIIIPCRNEEKFIWNCLDSIIKQDYFRFGSQVKENSEILVVDGASEDRTKEIVKNFQISNSDFQIKLLDNPKKIKPCALNIAIKSAKGDVVIVMDAHAGYQDNYISKCIEYLEKYKVDNVGGIIKTRPAENTLTARAIALCLSNFFGAAGSVFRVGSKKPRLVDTVFGGCFRKEVFKKIGLFNENLVRSQDMEFNLRLKKTGGKILLAPDIVCYYYPKPTLGEFFLHNVQDGIWAIYPLKFVKTSFKLRHYIPLIFVLGLFFSLILSIFSILGKILFILVFGTYLLFSLFFSLNIALREGLRYFFIMPVVFFIRHFGYGLGSLWGVVKVIA